MKAECSREREREREREGEEERDKDSVERLAFAKIRSLCTAINNGILLGGTGTVRFVGFRPNSKFTDGIPAY